MHPDITSVRTKRADAISFTVQIRQVRVRADWWTSHVAAASHRARRLSAVNHAGSRSSNMLYTNTL